ncbi:MAG: aminopeptidase P family protein [Gammaproteobacteria bacterium]|nr:aminopeptidase P family protein [Gammaproteobacteria bacterium]
MRRTILAALAVVACPAAISGEPVILPMKDRAAVIDRWLDARVETVLPMLMRRAGIDMWVIVSREYNEDPVIRTMLPSDWHAARRTTILLIHDRGEGEPLETLSVSRYAVGDIFEGAWNQEEDGEQWAHLGKLIDERNPRRIGLNYSVDFPLADGISHTEFELFMGAIPERLQERVVSAEDLAVGWLETRTPDEMAVYQNIVRIAHEILAEGLSEAVIQPGVTTTDDVVWWYRERIRELKLTTWFQPSVSIDRAEAPETTMSDWTLGRYDAEVIMPGDLIHVDFGITYLRLNTDTQQNAYVLKPGETDAPADLKKALANANRLQDILTGQFETGKTGNTILAETRALAIREGITPSIYTHPIGYHGHAAGPTIGMWDNQGDTPGNGDYPMYPNTAYSIELFAETEVPSWGKAVRIKLEEDAFFDGETTYYIDGRQRAFHLIPRIAPVQ